MPIGDENALPEPQWPLIERVDYYVTAQTCISLCVVEANHGIDLRFYKWRWNHNRGDWRVALANLSLSNIDILQLARDADRLARKYEIDIPAETASVGEGGDYPPSMVHTLSSDFSKRPACPHCDSSEGTSPIRYGFQGATDDFGDVEFSIESPVWFCGNCGKKWGAFDWKSGAITADDDVPF